MLGDFAVRCLANLDKRIKISSNSTCHAVGLARPQGESIEFELAAVMRFKDLCHEVGDGVLTEVRRKIGHPNF